MTTMKYSVIIPVYNRPYEVDELLSSFTYQYAQDMIKEIKKYLKVGMYDQVYILEKELHEVYGMSYSEIEKAEFA